MPDESLREELIADLCRVMNATIANKAYETYCLNHPIWKWIEGEGHKYLDQNHWSIEALKVYSAHGYCNPGELVHEHVVPRNVIRRLLLNSKEMYGTLRSDEVRKILNSCGQVAIISKAEDIELSRTLGGGETGMYTLRSEMPQGWRYDETAPDKWSRYRHYNGQAIIGKKIIILKMRSMPTELDSLTSLEDEIHDTIAKGSQTDGVDAARQALAYNWLDCIVMDVLDSKNTKASKPIAVRPARNSVPANSSPSASGSPPGSAFDRAIDSMYEKVARGEKI